MALIDRSYAEIVEAHRYLSATGRLSEALENGTPILNVVMPNGKRLAECTGEEVGEMGARMTEIASWLPTT